MTDDEYVEELRAILTGLNPVGSGSGARVLAMRIVRDTSFDELAIDFEAVIDGVDRGSGSLRVDIDREWRELSGYADPGSYVQVVVRALEKAAYLVRREWTEPTLDPDEAWADLLLNLGYHGTVREVGNGRLEVTDDGDAFTVLVTREQWAEVWAHESDDFFHDLLGPRHRDESFVVYHRGDLVRSVREQLPPVASIELRLESERMRQLYEAAIARDPNARIGWYAVRPDGTEDRFADHRDGDGAGD